MTGLDPKVATWEIAGVIAQRESYRPELMMENLLLVFCSADGHEVGWVLADTARSDGEPTSSTFGARWVSFHPSAHLCDVSLRLERSDLLGRIALGGLCTKSRLPEPWFDGLSSNCSVFEGLAGAPGQARGHCPYACRKASCVHTFRPPRGLI